jgi:hypothetical protein
MGLSNLELAHARWGHLRGDQFRALEWMALRSWDLGKERHGDQPRQYWAGYRNLAYGLGLITEVESRKVDKPLTRSHKERVRRALNDLADRDAVTILRKGSGRETTLVALHLDLATVSVLRPSTDALDLSASEALS